MVQVFSYKVGKGDFFRIRFGNEENGFHNILIDGGFCKNEKEMRNSINAIDKSGERVDAFILTHWDRDHIGGLLSYFQKRNHLPEAIGKETQILMNTGTEKELLVKEPSNLHSAEQAVKLKDLIEKRNLTWIHGFGQGTDYKVGSATLRGISPDQRRLEAIETDWEKEAGQLHSGDYESPDTFEAELDREIKKDKESPNGSSIAFLFEYDDVRLAFLGDAWPDVCAEGLKARGYTPANPCKAALIKVPHHGSDRNYSKELYQLLVSENYLISTEGGKGSGGRLLPNKSLLARLAFEAPHEGKDIRFYCNYRWWVGDSRYKDYFRDAFKKQFCEERKTLTVSVKDPLKKEAKFAELTFVPINQKDDIFEIIPNKLELWSCQRCQRKK